MLHAFPAAFTARRIVSIVFRKPIITAAGFSEEDKYVQTAVKTAYPVRASRHRKESRAFRTP